MEADTATAPRSPDPAGKAEAVARALLRRAATDPEPMLLVKAAELLLPRRLNSAT